MLTLYHLYICKVINVLIHIKQQQIHQLNYSLKMIIHQNLLLMFIKNKEIKKLSYFHMEMQVI